MSQSCRGLVVVLAASLGLAACGDDLTANPKIDAAVDAVVIDAPVDVGPCGSDRMITGELVDLDSSTTSFMGVNNARFTVQGQPGSTDNTSPNGRFELCAPMTASIVLDMDAIDDHLDGFAYIEAEALDHGLQPISFRSMTGNRAATFFVERGLVYDAARAQVMVYLAGDRSALTLDRAHDAVQGANDDDGDGTYTWANGLGRYTLFPNVEVTAATGVLTGDTSGPHTIPLAAGKLTVVALYWVFL